MKVLAIGAHPDDVELAVGGTLAKHKKLGDEVHILICTLGGVDNNPARIDEAKKGAEIIGADQLYLWNYDYKRLNIYNRNFTILLRRLFDQLKPDRVYTHSKYDLHQVHVTVSKCTVKASSNIKQVIFYESLSSTTREFKPDAFIDITEEIDTKIKAIKAHKTQAKRLYMHSMAIRSLANYRYVQNRVGDNSRGYAEAFMIHRLNL